MDTYAAFASNIGVRYLTRKHGAEIWMDCHFYGFWIKRVELSKYAESIKQKWKERIEERKRKSWHPVPGCAIPRRQLMSRQKSSMILDSL